MLELNYFFTICHNLFLIRSCTSNYKRYLVEPCILSMRTLPQEKLYLLLSRNLDPDTQKNKKYLYDVRYCLHLKRQFSSYRSVASDLLWKISLFYSNKIKAKGQNELDKICLQQNTHVQIHYFTSLLWFTIKQRAISSIPFQNTILSCILGEAGDSFVFSHPFRK